MTDLDENGLLVAAPDAIFTFTGRFIRPLDPDPANICIEDIAHALSMQCRWTGHVSKFYSVAEHSLHVAALVPEPVQLWALLHDATEAYLADLARPIKKAPGLGEIYLDVEAKLAAAIGVVFGIAHDPLTVAEIKQADERMLWAEAKVLLPKLGEQMPDPGFDCPRPQCWEPEVAEEIFLATFAEYQG